MSTASAISIPVGEYELLEGIEPDAVSELWVARSMVNPGRVVRLLRLKREVAGDVAARDGFLTSLRAAARTRSPLVLRVLAVGEQGDDVYAVLEHLEGVTLVELADLARDAGEPLPLGITLRIGLDVAAALESMHVAHGDLTPRSVYLTAGGIALISPTGLAVAACRGNRTGSLRRLAYKAPEQLSSEKAAKGDARSDVYSLAAILIEAIHGRPLVAGTSAESILASVQSAEVPDLDLPEKLGAVLRRAVARDPAGRYADAGEFGRALEAVASDLLADRREVTDSFWRLVGNDIAARRFELQSLVDHVDEEERPDLDLSQLSEMERAAERAAEAFHSEVSSVPPPPEAEAEAQEEPAEREGSDEATEPVRASGVVGATPAPAQEPRRAEPAKKQRAAKKPAPAAVARERQPVASGKRARAAAPIEREPPSARAVENRKVVIGIVVGAAAILLLGVVLHRGKTEEPAATEQANSPAMAAPPKETAQPEPPVAKTAEPEPAAAPAETASAAAPVAKTAEPEPAAAPAETATAEPAAAAPEPAETAGTPATKKKRKWIPLPTATAKASAATTATAPPKSSAPPTASFGEIPGGL